MFKRLVIFKRKSKGGLIGLDIGSSSIKAVALQGRGGALSLASVAQASLQPDSIVDGQIMELNDVSNVITNILDSPRIKTDRVAAGVGGHSVIVKNIVVPQMSKEELEESIDWHAEEHIPFDISDVSLDYQIVGSGPDTLHVLMAACKRERVANLKQAVQLAGKQPAIIDLDVFALQNCYEINYQPSADQTVALLNIGAATMNINILQGTRSVFTRDASVGGNQYTNLLQKELNLTFDEAESLKCAASLTDGSDDGGGGDGGESQRDIRPVLEAVSDILALEIQKTFDFYRATAEDSGAAVQKIYISGGAAKLQNLAEFLAQRFEVSVEFFDPFRNIKVDGKQFDSDYIAKIRPEMAVAVGLALRGVEA